MNSKYTALSTLLASCFEDSEELHAFVRRNYGEISARMPSGLSLVSSINEIITLLDQRAMIDGFFFGQLSMEYPRRAGEIETIAKDWNVKEIPRLRVDDVRPLAPLVADNDRRPRHFTRQLVAVVLCAIAAVALSTTWLSGPVTCSGNVPQNDEETVLMMQWRVLAYKISSQVCRDELHREKCIDEMTVIFQESQLRGISALRDGYTPRYVESFPESDDYIKLEKGAIELRPQQVLIGCTSGRCGSLVCHSRRSCFELWVWCSGEYECVTDAE